MKILKFKWLAITDTMGWCARKTKKEKEWSAFSKRQKGEEKEVAERELGRKNREEEGVVTNFFFFFFSFSVIYSCRPKLVYQPKLAGMPKLAEIGGNFFRGGTRGFLIPVCTPVRDFLAGTERYIQLWLIYATHP